MRKALRATWSMPNVPFQTSVVPPDATAISPHFSRSVDAAYRKQLGIGTGMADDKEHA